MAGKVRFDFVGFEIPYLKQELITRIIRVKLLTFSVLSLLALTSSRESADHVSRYTAPTCPRNVATNLGRHLLRILKIT